MLATERTDAEHLFGFAVVLVICAGLSDFFDGYIARKQGISSIVGAFWDTTADKILVSGVLIALVSVDRASVWVTFIIMTREFVCDGGPQRRRHRREGSPGVAGR